MEVPPRGQPRTALAVTLALVIALAASVVAVMLFLLFDPLDEGTAALNDRLEAAGASFTRIPHPP